MKIQLVPLRRSHAPSIVRAMQVEGFLDGLLYFKPLTISEATNDIRTQLSQEKEGTMIVRSIKVKGRIVGRIGLKKRQEWFLWYWIDPACQGKRLMTRALQLFLQELTLPTIFAAVKPWNTPSLRLLLRAGFVHVGVQSDKTLLFRRTSASEIQSADSFQNDCLA